MKSSILFTLALFICFSTAFGQNGYYNNNNNYNNQQEMNYNNYNNGQRGNGDTKVFALKDPNTGMVSAYMPFPSNWQITATGFSGPNGIECGERAGGSSARDGMLFQSVDQVIKQMTIPQLQQAGIRVSNIIDLPQIARTDEHNGNRYWEYMPTQKTYQAKGIEFTDPQGKPGIVIVHFRLAMSQFGGISFYYYSGLSANANAYNKAKQAFIYGLANLKISDEAVTAHNQSEQQKASMRDAAYNKRRKENQDHFNAMNRIHNESTNAINDMQMEMWRNKNESSDRIHERNVDAVWERESATNPWGGGQVKVTGNYKYYFMNSNGQYFGTNNPNYNPSRDPNMNHLNWKPMKKN